METGTRSGACVVVAIDGCGVVVTLTTWDWRTDTGTVAVAAANSILLQPGAVNCPRPAQSRIHSHSPLKPDKRWRTRRNDLGLTADPRKRPSNPPDPPGSSNRLHQCRCLRQRCCPPTWFRLRCPLQLLSTLPQHSPHRPWCFRRHIRNHIRDWYNHSQGGTRCRTYSRQGKRI
jgi:hypothetical protein